MAAVMLQRNHSSEMNSREKTTWLAALAVAAALSASPAAGEYTCEAEGIFADPDACENFIQCVEVPEDGDVDFNKYINPCAPGTLWEPCDLACENPVDVICGARPYPNGTVDDPNGPVQCEDYADTSTIRTTTTVIDTTTEEGPDTTTDDSSDTTTDGGSDTTTDDDIDTTTDGGIDTTTEEEETTTDDGGSGGSTTAPHPRYPNKIIGFYLSLADDTEEGFETDSDYEPLLYEYQQQGANVLFFCFINPLTMEVPTSFIKLASSRGTGEDGAVPADTVILFAVGGYSYSLDPYNPWPWLESREAAEAMAEEVAEWRFLYNADGIDLDIETGAGDAPGAGENMIYFIEKLRELSPDFIVGQPTFGYPQVQAEIDVINASWEPDGTSNDLADSVGLMVYEGTTSLDYVENYAHGTEQWEGFPITTNVPYNSILLGAKGIIAPADVQTLADEVDRQDLLGIMVWYASVRNGLQYDLSWDASLDEDSQQAYVDALNQITA